MEIVKKEVERVEYITVKFDSKKEKIKGTKELEKEGWELLDPATEDLTVMYRQYFKTE